MNVVLLRGEIVKSAEFSHESYGQRYYQADFSTMRLSGAVDRLRVLIGEQLLRIYDPCVGDQVEIQGQIRSFNNKSGVGSRLVISVAAQKIAPTTEGHCNKVELSGAICKEPMYRRTPLGREICDLMVAVQRPYGRADYLPVIAWGACARACMEMVIGDRVDVEGRFQSRQYMKLTDGQPVEKTAYEISAIHIEKNTGSADKITDNQ